MVVPEVWMHLDNAVLEVVGVNERQTRMIVRRGRELVTDIVRMRWSVPAASVGKLATARRPVAMGVRDKESGSGALMWTWSEPISPVRSSARSLNDALGALEAKSVGTAFA